MAGKTMGNRILVAVEVCMDSLALGKIRNPPSLLQSRILFILSIHVQSLLKRLLTSMNRIDRIKRESGISGQARLFVSRSGIRRAKPGKRYLATGWIPAFAGMTMGEAGMTMGEAGMTYPICRPA